MSLPKTKDLMAQIAEETKERLGLVAPMAKAIKQAEEDETVLEFLREEHLDSLS